MTKGWVGLALVAALAPALAGCSAEPSPVGAREENGRLAVFLPVCLGDELAWVRVQNNEKPAEPARTWYDPVTPQARGGRVFLDAPAQFARAEGPPLETLPRQVWITYSSRDGHTGSRAFDVADVPPAGPAPDVWWTARGMRTESAIAGRLRCGAGG